MTKKLLILTAAFLCAATSVSAQLRTVNRLPEIGPSVETTYSDNPTGFWAAVELSGGTSCRLNKDNSGFGELDAVAGYRFSDFLRIGAGVGGRYYINSDDVLWNHKIRWSFPLYVDLRGNFIPSDYRNVVPYWSFDVGGAIRDGFMARPSLGIRVGRERCAFLLSLSYTLQRMKVRELRKYDLGYKHFPECEYVSLISLRLGYEF